MPGINESKKWSVKAGEARVGESVALSVVNRIHGLSMADWNRIPVMHGRKALPTFDYQVASDGSRLIQVEAKGNCTRTPGKIDGTSAIASNIRGKKRRIRDAEVEETYPHPADLRYGTIIQIGRSPNQPIHCLLLDPESDVHEDPYWLRVLNRERFLYYWISTIGPRSQLRIALRERVNLIEHLRSSESLQQIEAIPLLKDGEAPFDNFGRSTWQISSFERKPAPFFSRKSYVKDGPAGGMTVQLDNGNLFFVGFQEALLDLATEQNFKKLLDYRHNGGKIEKTVVVNLSETEMKRLRNREIFEALSSEAGRSYKFELSGTLFYSAEGLCFGELITPTHRRFPRRK